jgi:hypothetical protein
MLRHVSHRCTLAAALLCAVSASVLSAGCHTPTVGLAPSILPNLGLAASLGLPLAPRSAWQLEARFTDQWLDDKSIADNGFPEAGNWTQLDLGALWIDPAPASDSRWILRFGTTAFEFRGEPNMVEEPGEYLGLYIGAGRLTLFAHRWLIGPELTLLVASGDDPRVVVPQITWGVRTGW